MVDQTTHPPKCHSFVGLHGQIGSSPPSCGCKIQIENREKFYICSVGSYTHTYAHAHVYLRVCTYVGTNIQTRTRTHTHKHTHITVTIRFVTWHYFALLYNTLFHNKSHYVTLCYIMLHYLTAITYMVTYIITYIITYIVADINATHINMHD